MPRNTVRHLPLFLLSLCLMIRFPLSTRHGRAYTFLRSWTLYNSDRFRFIDIPFPHLYTLLCSLQLSVFPRLGSTIFYVQIHLPTGDGSLFLKFCMIPSTRVGLCSPAMRCCFSLGGSTFLSIFTWELRFVYGGCNSQNGKGGRGQVSLYMSRYTIRPKRMCASNNCLILSVCIY